MAVTISTYYSFKEYIGDGTIDLDTHSFKVMLLNNSHSFNSAHTVKADIVANEIANGNGYTTGGVALSSVTWNSSGGTTTWDADDAYWDASGGAITAYYAAIYDDTPSSPADPLCFSINLDGVQTAADGARFKLRWNASGIFTLT